MPLDAQNRVDLNDPKFLEMLACERALSDLVNNSPATPQELLGDPKFQKRALEALRAYEDFTGVLDVDPQAFALDSIIAHRGNMPDAADNLF